MLFSMFSELEEVVSGKFRRIMNTDINSIIDSVDLRKPDSVAAAASRLLSEDNLVKAGQTCAVIDDPTFPLAGIKVKVKTVDGGYADCEAPNGQSYKLQTSLLLPQ